MIFLFFRDFFIFFFRDFSEKRLVAHQNDFRKQMRDKVFNENLHACGRHFNNDNRKAVHQSMRGRKLYSIQGVSKKSGTISTRDYVS